MELIFEDKEGFQDLEAMLYSQVHHESAENNAISNSNPNSSTVCAPKNPISAKTAGKLSNRYWNRESNNAPSVSQRESSPKLSYVKPYVSPMSAFFKQDTPLTNKSSRVAQNASKGNPKNKGSKKKFNDGGNKGPFTAKSEKLKKVMKIFDKKKNAQKAKEAAKGIASEVVVIDSSDNDDDVFEIPMPPPPLVTIDSSDEESEIGHGSNKLKGMKSKGLGSPSSSVVSDDFIGQRDCSRLVNEGQIADDESLQFPPQTVEDAIYQNETQQSNKSNLSKENYSANRSNFRDLDVYESESSDRGDMCKRKRASSDSSMTPQKGKKSPKLRAKKTKKSAASVTAKSADVSDDSSESEEEFISTGKKSSTPHIKPGEAVENMRNKITFESSKTRVNSDNEFLNMLSTIVRGESSDDEEDTTEENQITARVLAEDVLDTAATPTKPSNRQAERNVSENDIPRPPRFIHNQPQIDDDLEDAIPTDVADAVNAIFLGDRIAEQDVEDREASDGDVLVLGDEDEDEEGFDKAITVVHTNETDVGWNEEMKKFYHESWKGEGFDVNEIRKDMGSAATRKWAICQSDRYVIPKPFTKLKCHNCMEFGHAVKNCRKPRREIVCHMCGEIGHREPRCPNSICLHCGKKTSSFMKFCSSCAFQKRVMCSICKMQGHIADLCPDTWRRYHSTLPPNIDPVDNVVHNKRKKFCSTCARKGHLAEQCRFSTNLLDYPVSTAQIKSYQNTYDNIDTEAPSDVNGFNLFCNPSDPFEFHFSKNVKPNHCYGRFLAAVGLDKVQKRVDHADEPARSSAKKRRMVLNPFSEKCKAKKANLARKNADVSDENLTLNVSQETSTSEVDTSHIIKSIDMNEDVENVENTTVPEETENFNKDESGNKPDAEESDNNTETPSFIPIVVSDKHARPKSLADFKAARIGGMISCFARIFLPKFPSRILMSPRGHTFLNETMKKFSVKTSFENTSYGNVLVLEGRPVDQDKFHKELLEYLSNILVESNRERLRNSQKIPRKTETLLRFLEADILLLKKDYGKIEEQLKRLKGAENQFSVAGLRLALRIKRILNIIIFGQRGFGDGRMHLQALNKYIEELKSFPPEKVISDQMREDIQEHWNYIFACKNECDYEKLIKQCTNSRKFNVPKENKPQKANIPCKSNQINNARSPGKGGLNESEYWSVKCKKLIEDNMELGELPRNIANKLDQVRQKAAEKMLSRNDYDILMKIYNHIRKSLHQDFIG